MAPATYSLSASQQKTYDEALQNWRTQNKTQRLWSKDAALWSGTDEAKWLGWLDIVPQQLAKVAEYRQLAEEVRARGFQHAVLLGMGGSSLCPEVLSLSFPRVAGYPEMLVLDSTDPAQAAALDRRIDPSKALFIVASKSGSTLEPNVFKQYFFDRAGRDGSRFIAITDPGSKMQQVAEHDGFWKIFYGVPQIGGRYSALSAFGMVPAAVMGLDVEKFLTNARAMVEACSPQTPDEQNPGVTLGLLLGTLANAGRDKLTVIASPGIHDLGAWMEQLVAESTGKDGKAIIPVDREAIGEPSAYGDDRVFVYARLDHGADASQDAAVLALEKAGQPVIRIGVKDAYQLGAEFFRWEIATAVAGALMGINPFNQPDVEASKIETRKLTDEFERTGSLPAEEPAFTEQGIAVYGATSAKTLKDAVAGLLGSLGKGDYFALLAYIDMNWSNEQALDEMRTQVRDSKGVATCLGFGPRFLHSTGQAYKGGSNNGVFLQITCEDAKDLPVPGASYTFGIVKAAQSRGDLAVLVERKRRALRIHLGKDVGAGLKALGAAVAAGL